MALSAVKQIFIDHHAHTMRQDFLQLDAIGLRQPFSESRSITQIQRHTPNMISYMDCIDKLGKLLQVQGEEKILELRASMSKTDYVNRLFDDASLGAFIVDDGFLPANGMSISRFAQLCERPVFRCRRIESALEEALEQSTNFQELEKSFPNLLLQHGDMKTVSLKTIAAYRGGLEIDTVSRQSAIDDFDRTKRTLQSDGRPRVMRGALYHHFLLETFDLAQSHNLPVQVHTGIGDQDEDLRLANPLYLRNILESGRFAHTNFVFLHCYPFVRESAHLASLYANAYMDISLISFLASPALQSSFLEALSLAPASKILASTDGHSIPETYWYGARSLKRALTAALNELVSRNYLTDSNAEHISGLLLHGNAKMLYELPGLS